MGALAPDITHRNRRVTLCFQAVGGRAPGWVPELHQQIDRRGTSQATLPTASQVTARDDKPATGPTQRDHTGERTDLSHLLGPLMHGNVYYQA